MNFNHLNNQQLINRINHLYKKNKNDDDEVFEMCKRRDKQGFKTKIIGEKFVIIKQD